MLSYIEISKENLVHNFKLFREFVGNKKEIAALVKANAYGHGQNEIVRALEKEADYFQIDDLQELELIRQVTKKPVLVFGYVAKDELARAVELDGILTIYDEERLRILDKIGADKNKKIKIHVKIDAQLGRQGLLREDIPDFLSALKKTSNIVLDGVYAHFANIEDTSDFSHAQKQIDAFGQTLEIFKEHGFCNFKKHISASSGILVHEKENRDSDLVRLGIALYGMWPSKELRERFENDQFKLKSVMRWVSHLAQVKTLPANHTVGYGLTYKTTKPTKVAVVPQGYSDGFDRGLSNSGEVLIGGTRCPVLGRVAMNMFVVDVSHLENVKTEDEVVLLGTQGNEEITAEEMAEKLGTINYEITTRTSPLLERVLK